MGMIRCVLRHIAFQNFNILIHLRNHLPELPALFCHPKEGKVISYQIRVSRGRGTDGRRLKDFQMAWTPEPGMTKQRIEKELQRQTMHPDSLTQWLTAFSERHGLPPYPSTRIQAHTGFFTDFRGRGHSDSQQTPGS